MRFQQSRNRFLLLIRYIQKLKYWILTTLVDVTLNLQRDTRRGLLQPSKFLFHGS